MSRVVLCPFGGVLGICQKAVGDFVIIETGRHAVQKVHRDRLVPKDRGVSPAFDLPGKYQFRRRAFVITFGVIRRRQN